MRREGDNIFNLGTIFNLIYPLIVSFFVYFLLVRKLGFSYNTPGYEDVLGSIINFSSIIIGFYTAMYGIMISLLDSDIFHIFRKNRVEGFLKFQLYDSLIASFAILLLSIIMQVLIKQKLSNNAEIKIVTIFFSTWNLVLGYFVATSFRSISILLKMMFKNNKENYSSDDEKKQRQKQIDEMKRK
ncbi:hypothetical protein [Enterococcus casseliflavus]|uniref:hypothetical protein n=1 Tax=Enterococcus casseliflavus TaxID=37734 RepID=UPI00232F2EAD|nr:hypothetical protein [Enterococcus casseliflavus]MDB1689845.1 hypothetical protein [Enterococcus casseliflavus]